jgi:hypothetical protein
VDRAEAVMLAVLIRDSLHLSIIKLDLAHFAAICSSSPSCPAKQASMNLKLWP